jgi:hypothetical protein
MADDPQNSSCMSYDSSSSRAFKLGQVYTHFSKVL